jgi:hypothetical protein
MKRKLPSVTEERERGERGHGNGVGVYALGRCVLRLCSRMCCKVIDLPQHVWQIMLFEVMSCLKNKYFEAVHAHV